MKRNQSSIKGYIFCVFALSLILCSTTAFGDVIQVPGDYKTIQEAVDVASKGDTVLVADGTYTGEGNKNIDFNGKELTLQSENGPDNCIIDCEDDGRGFYFHKGELKNSVVSGFTVINGRAIDCGGGIYCSNSSPTITNCIIRNNTVAGNSNNCQGGGIYFGCGSSPTLTNCIIMENSSNYRGGGIYFYNAGATVTNCTITKNIALEGGGIYYRYKPAPVITNSILWGNTPNEVSKDLLCKDSPKISYSLVQGGYSGTGNIDTDPLFIGAGDYYHLTKKSPCINVATSKGAPDRDIDGDSRPQRKRIDMGADEYSDKQKRIAEK